MLASDWLMKHEPVKQGFKLFQIELYLQASSSSRTHRKVLKVQK